MQKDQAPPARGETRANPARKSTRHVTVDDRFAESLVQDFPAFSVVEVREALEFEPVRCAIGILRWASSRPEPARALLRWARKWRRGYHRPASGRPDGRAEYGRIPML